MSDPAQHPPAVPAQGLLVDPSADPAASPTAPSTRAPVTASPTLADVARLTPESDYSAFTAPGVDEQVRNQALRKLFLSAPHFQQSDGLDVAIDEVVQLAQSPLARQRKILQARAMGMLDDDLVDQPEPEADRPPA